MDESIVDVLLQAGAKRCYGVVGNTINHLTDAIRRSEMDWVLMRHEEVGGFAAGGEAMITGELAVCAGTCGPGGQPAFRQRPVRFAPQPRAGGVHRLAGGQRRTLASLMHGGTTANAYPQAIGAAKAFPGRQVIALCGDGGMSMSMGDLLTLVQEKIPVKIVVYNDRSLDFVEIEQKVDGRLDAYTELLNPDFGRLAEAIGLWGRKIEHGNDLEAGIADLLAHDGPGILDVKINRMELVMPPN